jgi:hypothetical protein
VTVAIEACDTHALMQVAETATSNRRPLKRRRGSSAGGEDEGGEENEEEKEKGEGEEEGEEEEKEEEKEKGEGEEEEGGAAMQVESRLQSLVKKFVRGREQPELFELLALPLMDTEANGDIAASILRGYHFLARLPGDAMLRAIEKHLTQDMAGFDCATVAHIIFDSAKMTKWTPGDDMMASLEERAGSVVENFNDVELPLVFMGFAMWNKRPGEELLAGLEGRIVSLVGSLSTETIGNVLWAYAKLGLSPDPEVLRVLEAQATSLFQKSSSVKQKYEKGRDQFEISGKVLFRMLLGLAKNGAKPGNELLKCLEWRLENLIKLDKKHIQKHVSDLVDSLWAFAKMGHRPCNDLMRKLGNMVVHKKKQMTAEDKKKIVWAYETFGCDLPKYLFTGTEATDRPMKRQRASSPDGKRASSPDGNEECASAKVSGAEQGGMEENDEDAGENDEDAGENDEDADAGARRKETQD